VSGTSKESELKLLACAHGSLRELLNDYHDVLRVRKALTWPKDSREARLVRRIGSNRDATYEAYRDFCEIRSVEGVANIAICLIHQTNYLLDQLRHLQRDFVEGSSSASVCSAPGASTATLSPRCLASHVLSLTPVEVRCIC
jgi:hypothetical protein